VTHYENVRKELALAIARYNAHVEQAQAMITARDQMIAYLHRRLQELKAHQDPSAAVPLLPPSVVAEPLLRAQK